MTSANTLSNMTVLVTRPQHQAEPLCQLIAANGGNALRLPTLAIESSLHAPDRQAISQLDQYDMAVFVSVNAVSFSLPLIQQRWSPWPQAVSVLAIGPATAAALQASGVSLVDMPDDQFNSEALLQLPALQQLQDRKILLFRGQGGRQYLADELGRRGAYLQEVICYRRALPKIDQQICQTIWQQQPIDVIICTSVTGMHNLFTLLGEAARSRLQQARWLVISERLLSVAQSLGIKNVPLLADNASDAAIMSTLLMLRK